MTHPGALRKHLSLAWCVALSAARRAVMFSNTRTADGISGMAILFLLAFLIVFAFQLFLIF